MSHSNSYNTSLLTTRQIQYTKTTTIRTTRSIKITYISPTNRTNNTYTIAKMKKNRISKRAPHPNINMNTTVPLKETIVSRTTSIPTPRPERSDNSLTVE